MIRVSAITILSLLCFYLPGFVYASESSDIQRLLSPIYTEESVGEIGWVYLVRILYGLESMIGFSVIDIWSFLSATVSYVILNKFSRDVRSVSASLFFLLFIVIVLLPATCINIRLLPVLLCLTYLPSLLLGIFGACFFHLSSSLILLPFVVDYVIKAIFYVVKLPRQISFQIVLSLLTASTLSSLIIVRALSRFGLYFHMFMSSAGAGIGLPIVLVSLIYFLYFFLPSTFLRHHTLKWPILISLLVLGSFTLLLLYSGNDVFAMRILQLCMLIAFAFAITAHRFSTPLGSSDASIAKMRINPMKIDLGAATLNLSGLISFSLSTYLFLSRIGYRG